MRLLNEFLAVLRTLFLLIYAPLSMKTRIVEQNMFEPYREQPEQVQNKKRLASNKLFWSHYGDLGVVWMILEQFSSFCKHFGVILAKDRGDDPCNDSTMHFQGFCRPPMQNPMICPMIRLMIGDICQNDSKNGIVIPKSRNQFWRNTKVSKTQRFEGSLDIWRICWQPLGFC